MGDIFTSVERTRWIYCVLQGKDTELYPLVLYYKNMYKVMVYIHYVNSVSFL